MGLRPSTRDFVVVTPSYDGADRCKFLLDTWHENDPCSFYGGPFPHVICADYTGKDATREQYDYIPTVYSNVEIVYRDSVGCCDGASRTAVEFALAQYDPKWIVLLSDDLAVSNGCMSNVFYFLEQNALDTLGAFQPPYWNCTDENHALEYYYPGIRRQHFYRSREWSRDVPRNPHWEHEHAVPYHSVHGSSMVVRAQTYREVGGFAEGSWRYDETLSYRIWTRSQKAIAAIPGPPLVHYMGGGFQSGPKVDWRMGDEEHYLAATGVTIPEAIRVIRAIMTERAPRVEEEMRQCRYWDRREL